MARNYEQDIITTINGILDAYKGIEVLRLLHGDLHPDHIDHRKPLKYPYMAEFENAHHCLSNLVVSLYELKNVVPKIQDLENWKKKNNIRVVNNRANSQISKTL